jgi:DNA-binding PadR family transcriptional regulator
MKKKEKIVDKIKKNASAPALELKGFLSFFILHELSQKKLSGDELAEKIGQRKNATLTPGTIYPALKRLKKQKLIRFKRQGRKKLYELTEIGNKQLKQLYTLFSTYFKGLKKIMI